MGLDQTAFIKLYAVSLQAFATRKFTMILVSYNYKALYHQYKWNSTCHVDNITDYYIHLV